MNRRGFLATMLAIPAAIKGISLLPEKDPVVLFAPGVKGPKNFYHAGRAEWISYEELNQLVSHLENRKARHS